MAHGFRRDPQRGAIAILMGLSLTVLLGFAALGFDLAYVRLARQELRNSIDAASHAAANTLRITNSTASAIAAGKLIASQNTIMGQPLTLIDANFTFGGYNFLNNTFTPSGSPPNAVQINSLSLNASNPSNLIQLSFGRPLGYSESDTTAVAQTAFRRRNVILEMDITGSFAMIGGSVNSSNIDNAVAADVAFLDTMYASRFETDSLGLDLFTGSGDEVPSGITHYSLLQPLQAGYAAMRFKWYGDGKRSDDVTKSSGIAVCDQTGVSTTWPNHPWVHHCWDGGESGYGVQLYAGTNIGAAIKAGTEQLVAATKDWETRVLIVLTDGGPLCCQSRQGGGLTAASEPNRCGDGSPTHLDWGNYCGNTAKAVCRCAQDYYTNAIAQADAAATKNIILYTIVFGSYDPWVEFAALLPRNGGTAYNTPDSTALAGILKEIAGKIPVSMTK